MLFLCVCGFVQKIRYWRKYQWKNDKIDNFIELIKNKEKKTDKTILKKRVKIKKVYKK